VVATRNAHKVREILRICHDWPVAWITDAALPEVEETGRGYLENALLKAVAAAAASGEAALADDSGIEVDALGGGPGPRSARYAGEGATDEANLRALLGALAGIPRGGRTARYRAVAVLADPGGEEVHAEGTCEGIIGTEPRGTGGFGYDPIFEPAAERPGGRTLGLYSPAEKHAISHRARAARRMAPVLRELGF
jgi:XTP/dITP diphosphohydrolase